MKMCYMLPHPLLGPLTITSLYSRQDIEMGSHVNILRLNAVERQMPDTDGQVIEFLKLII